MQRNAIYIVHGAFILASITYMILFRFFMQYPDVETNWIVSWIFVGISAASVLLGLIVPFIMGRLINGDHKAQTLTVVSGAFLETIGIYGLIGPFVGIPSIVCYSLMAASTVLLLLNTPRVIVWSADV